MATVSRKLPDNVVAIMPFNQEQFVCMYRVPRGRDNSVVCYLKLTDCDPMEITETSYNELLETLSKD